MPGKYLSDVEKSKILTLIGENVSLVEIARRTGHGIATIKRLKSAAAASPTSDVPPRKPIPGRPRKTTKATDKLLKREVLKNPRMSAAELKKAHPSVLGNVSERTIQNRLQKELCLPSRSPAKKPLLIPRMMKQRLEFAKKYQNWTAEDWSKVMWSDESTFRCVTVRQGRVRRPVGASRYDSRFTEKTVKHPDSVMLWGCFSGECGRGGLYFLPRNVTMNGERYIEVLRDHMLTFYSIHRCSFFMHDSAPCHKAKKVTNFLRENDIQVLDWPGNSPDLNPIENCWSYMKRKLHNCDTASVPRLINSLKKMWLHDMDADYFKNLSASMPKRLQLVIKAKGGITKY